MAGPILSAAACPVVAAARVEAGRAPEARWASWGWTGAQGEGKAERRRRKGREGGACQSQDARWHFLAFRVLTMFPEFL